MSAIRKQRIYSIVQIIVMIVMCIYVITAFGLNGWKSLELNSPLGISLIVVIAVAFIVYIISFNKKVKLEDDVITAMDDMIWKEAKCIAHMLCDAQVNSSRKQLELHKDSR